MEKKFRKVVVIFIDILGSQSRVDFNEWYNVMSIFSRMIEHEKEYDSNHPWTVYKRETHVFQIAHTLFMTIRIILRMVEKICMN